MRSFRNLLHGAARTAGAAPISRRPKSARAVATPGVRRRIDIESDTKFQSYVEYQALYMDHETGRLIPNTEIWRDGELVIQVNSLGCKGPEIEPGAPVVAFFGDSTTLGVAADGWPYYVDVPGYAVLNAAVEGVEVGRMAGWFGELRRAAPIACVVVCAGWHNLIYNKTDERYWGEQLSRFLGQHVTAYWTVPTCLTDEFRERGISRLINTEAGADIDGDYFNFWSELDPDTLLVSLIDAIERYNAFVRDFCHSHGAVLLDLNTFLRPESYEEATRDFFDVCHMRPRAYERIGEYVGAILREALPPAGEAVTTTPAAVIAATEAEDLRKNIYPIW